MTTSVDERIIELKLSTIKEELNRCWTQVDRQGDIRLKIKTWCTTVWVATLAVYENEYLRDDQALILVFFSIAAFYLMELYWVGVGHIWKARRTDVENFLADVGRLDTFDSIAQKVLTFNSPGLSYSRPRTTPSLGARIWECVTLPSIVLPYYLLLGVRIQCVAMSQHTHNKAFQRDAIAVSHLLQKAQKLRHGNSAPEQRR